MQLKYQELRFGPPGQWRPLGGTRPSLRAASSEDVRRHVFDPKNISDKACHSDVLRETHLKKLYASFLIQSIASRLIIYQRDQLDEGVVLDRNRHI